MRLPSSIIKTGTNSEKDASHFAASLSVSTSRYSYSMAFSAKNFFTLKQSGQVGNPNITIFLPIFSVGGGAGISLIVFGKLGSTAYSILSGKFNKIGRAHV